jgi:hypothetical protein
MMLYLRGFFLLLTFFVQLFPMVISLWKLVMQKREADARKQLARELIEAQKLAARTGDTKKLEELLEGEKKDGSTHHSRV